MANEEDKEIDVVNPIYEEKEIKNIKSDRVFDDDEFQKISKCCNLMNLFYLIDEFILSL
jgi:hypothetical protein